LAAVGFTYTDEGHHDQPALDLVLFLAERVRALAGVGLVVLEVGLGVGHGLRHVEGVLEGAALARLEREAVGRRRVERHAADDHRVEPLAVLPAVGDAIFGQRDVQPELLGGARDL
jgi:hypothetical protein